MRSIGKRAAAFCSVIFICLIVLATCFVFVGIGHDCIGESCKICFFIDTESKLLKSVALLAVACALISAAFIFNFKRIFFFVNDFFQSSLISLKTKLSD